MANNYFSEEFWTLDYWTSRYWVTAVDPTGGDFPWCIDKLVQGGDAGQVYTNDVDIDVFATVAGQLTVFLQVGQEATNNEMVAGQVFQQDDLNTQSGRQTTVIGQLATANDIAASQILCTRD